MSLRSDRTRIITLVVTALRAEAETKRLLAALEAAEVEDELRPQAVQPVLTLKEAAARIKASPGLVRAFIRRGELPAARVGKKLWREPTTSTGS